MAQVDPELLDAVDKFFDTWKERVKTRLEAVAEKHADTWDTLTNDQIMALLMEELTDFFAYGAMFQHRMGNFGG